MDMSNPTGPVRVAAVQHAPVFLNVEASLEKASALVGEAANEGAKLIIFPETWLPGYPVWLDASPNAALWDHRPAKALYRLLADNAITIPGMHLDRLLDLARETGAYIVMGAHERLHGTLYNTMVLIDREGQDIVIHRKLVPTYSERLVWGRGDGSTLGVMDTEYGNLGGLICWEHWMPLLRAAMHARHETIHVAQWPSAHGLHQLASRHYAFEGQCFVVVAGCVLTRNDIMEGIQSLDNPDGEALELFDALPDSGTGLLQTGGSAVIGPDAKYVEGPVFDRACIVYADIELERITEGHLVIDTDGHYSRPDLFSLDVNTQPQLNVTFGRGS